VMAYTREYMEQFRETGTEALEFFTPARPTSESRNVVHWSLERDSNYNLLPTKDIRACTINDEDWAAIPITGAQRSKFLKDMTT
jgi:hypothetical protein